MSSEPQRWLGSAKAEEEAEEEELVDPMDVMRDDCGQKGCASLQTRLAECNARVSSRKKTEETCMEELIDFMHCVDHCVSHSLFSKLK